MAQCKEDQISHLIAERWDSPVIVTTSVRFFEELFKSKPADLRSLHSIANSVIVFDEAQSIPCELTGTTIESMRALCETFGCSVLFSTATQPAFNIRKDILFNAREIMDDPADIYKRIRLKAMKMPQTKCLCCFHGMKLTSATPSISVNTTPNYSPTAAMTMTNLR